MENNRINWKFIGLNQEIASIKTTNLLDVSSFEKGVYFLKIKTKYNTIVKRKLLKLGPKRMLRFYLVLEWYKMN